MSSGSSHLLEGTFEDVEDENPMFLDDYVLVSEFRDVSTQGESGSVCDERFSFCSDASQSPYFSKPDELSLSRQDSGRKCKTPAFRSRLVGTFDRRRRCQESRS